MNKTIRAVGVYRLNPSFKDYRSHTLNELHRNNMSPDVSRYDRLFVTALNGLEEDLTEIYQSRIWPRLQEAEIRDERGIVLLVTYEDRISECFFTDRKEKQLTFTVLDSFFHGLDDVICDKTQGLHIRGLPGTWKADGAQLYEDTLYWTMRCETGEVPDKLAVVDGRGTHYGYVDEGFSDHTFAMIEKRKQNQKEQRARLALYNRLGTLGKEEKKKKTEKKPCPVTETPGREHTGKRVSIKKRLSEKRLALQEAT